MLLQLTKPVYLQMKQVKKRHHILTEKNPIRTVKIKQHIKFDSEITAGGLIPAVLCRKRDNQAVKSTMGPYNHD